MWAGQATLQVCARFPLTLDEESVGVRDVGVCIDGDLRNHAEFDDHPHLPIIIGTGFAKSESAIYVALVLIGAPSSSLESSTRLKPEPADEATEVVADGGEYGVAGVAFLEPEVAAPHAVLGLEMADDGSIADPRRMVRLIGGVTPRFRPEMKALNL
ncbi:hypothetical protein SAMN05216338_107820 [Bradyrhizobium sp. Rc2d]|nr:hypothetical protein SAMN05216338_107820 [Bradyrhizobium sp. Rc2d]